ncbi:MAG: DUF6492 family protein [Myxococcota bacterium]
MDAVLPLREHDVPRAELLLASLAARFEGLSQLWIVASAAELPRIQQRLARFEQSLSLRFESENWLVPELELVPLLKGWYKQQLIKLAISEHIETAFYLTLDADVICCRDVNPAALTPAGRASCHLFLEDLHPDWYVGSAATLGVAARRGVLHAVTPAVLHRDSVRELAAFLTERATNKRFSAGLRGLSQRLLLARASLERSQRYASWRVWLAASPPWTEYALYYTFLETTGAFERFHEYTPYCLYDVERSVWRQRAASFAHFDPSACFDGQGPPWFFIVQSNTRLEPELVRTKLMGYVDV